MIKKILKNNLNRESEKLGMLIGGAEVEQCIGSTLCTSMQGVHCTLVCREHTVYQCPGIPWCTSLQKAHCIFAFCILICNKHIVYQCAGSTLCTSVQVANYILVWREYAMYDGTGSMMCTSEQRAHMQGAPNIPVSKEHTVY